MSWIQQVNTDGSTFSERVRGEVVVSSSPTSRVAFCSPIDLVIMMWLMVSSALARSYDDRCDVDRLDNDLVVLNAALCLDPVAATIAVATADME